MNNNRQTDTLITALYERLSRDDEGVGESNSIQNQKRYLEDFAAQKGFSNCVHYTDDGWSGGNFDRPAWKQLVEDIEAGKVGTVITKDMSRIGREYLQTGYYTEIFFRQYDIHFIAIGSGVDSDDQTSSEFAPFMNVMSEWYLRDLSRKQKAGYQARSNAGIPTTNQVIYGYRKDPEQKHHWLIDEEAAAVVRRIFQLSVSGYGPVQIAKTLQADQVDRPSVYLAKRGIGTHKNTTDMSRPYDWDVTTIGIILHRIEYLGHSVNFRTTKESYKRKKVTQNSPEDWVIIENTHEAIVDQETWELAQQVRRTVHRTDKTETANPLTGLMFCADCGAKMYNHRGPLNKNKPDGGIDPVTHLGPSDHYDCSTYSLTFYHTDRKCCSHYISTKAVRALVLDAIRRVSQYAITNKEEFIQKVRETSEIQQTQAAKELKKQIAKAKKRSVELDSLIKKLYESYATGKISEERFDLLLADYEKEQKEVNALAASEQQTLDAYEQDTERINQFLALAKKYTDFTELTPQMIYEFVDRIEVHAPQKIDGERVQDVDIYLKYIGKFEVPVDEAEATPDPEEEKKRRRRAYEREYRRKKKQEKLEQEAMVQEAKAG
ncbi:MAG: DUF4368 domain-containing protein [Clostridia bacterium]|nr:DUF4368 domain-containing protein [Clostridia bacterium]